MKDFTYTNYSLGHKSCIDHNIMSGCIFDGIIRDNVLYDGDNPSNHNLLFLARLDQAFPYTTHMAGSRRVTVPFDGLLRQ